MSTEVLITIVNSTVALIISIIALVYTAKTYLLKSGANIRGSYGMCSSSVSCEDQYITNVTLENLKDRAIIVFKIYLRIGPNYFVEIEDFDEKPLILKPFEVFHKEYDPIDLYSINLNRIDLNSLFSSKRARKNIVLATSDGKYVVKAHINRWDPVYDFFKNHLTAVIHPRRATFKGKSYGLNTKYIVEITAENGKSEIIPIYPRDYEIKKFRKFRLTKDTLESKDSLEEYLYEQVGEGLLNCIDINVHDIGAWLEEAYESESKKTIEATYYSWLTYHIIGPVITKISDFRLRMKNRQMRKERANKKLNKDASR
ncbi:MAG: hypothetical protein JMN24_15145 [gamma proteobacterium endosymbiont of Lamellibrachia anaximandri]|nr:hypothetical protein [gamma proteobacterium endosymbiont of Lamellibrachia anaximandri]MBL3619705.1 hypothetical protein [gamma proteobacterium endosymbiont of Lamellibrachia anaximandri]